MVIYLLLNQKKNKDELINFLNGIEHLQTESSVNIDEVEIPVCYDEEFALDIKDVSKKTKINEDLIINSHLLILDAEMVGLLE